MFSCIDSPEKETTFVCAQTQPAVRRMNALQYQNSLHSLLDVDDVLFPPSTVGSGFRTYAQANRVSAAGAEIILEAAETAAEAVNWQELSQCHDPDDKDCPKAWLTDVAETAFKREASQQEIEEITGFLHSGMTVDEGVRLGIMVILNSPPFLYLDAMKDPHTAHARAARMSYFLWNDLPDDLLMNAVKSQRFTTVMEGRNEALRLIQSPNVLATIQSFHEDWLGLSALDDIYKDQEKYPFYDSELMAAFKIETQLFITEVFWMQDPRWAQLLGSNEGWVNAELAELYALDNQEAGWNKISFDATRPGILTRGAFLAAQANAASSSPVKRGAFVLRQLLCRDLAPPADVDMEIPAPSVDNPTIRERLAAHSSEPSCRACHDQIDPAGFAFEHFGGLGEWRSHWDGGESIDASGELALGSFNGADELMELIIDDDDAQACYVEKWASYALGRPVNEQDRCTVKWLTERFQSSGGHLPSLLADIAISPLLWGAE